LNDGKVRTLADRNLSFLGVGRGLHRFNDELELRGYIAYCARQMDAAMARWKAPEGTFADRGRRQFLAARDRAGVRVKRVRYVARFILLDVAPSLAAACGLGVRDWKDSDGEARTYRGDLARDMFVYDANDRHPGRVR
jgi:hypothetical protein